MKTTNAEPARHIAATIQFPDEIEQPLTRFSKQARLSRAAVARAALSYVLPLLLSGKLAIVNSEVRSMSAK